MNNYRKKIWTPVILAGILGMTLLAGCGDAGSAGKETSGEQISGESKISIVTTIFPEYDWVMQVLGDHAEGAEVIMLSDAGVDLHSFNPSVEDIVTVSDCDLFIYVGGESDAWVEDALKEARNQDMVTVNLLEVIGDRAKEEEIVEGMQDEEHHDHEDHDEEEESEYDEHVWLSLRNAQVIVDEIQKALGSVDPEHEEDYMANAAAYKEQLQALDESFAETVSGSRSDTLLFADRFPFRYLVDDYDLNYYAAFSGCSAETEASFETITFLAEKLDELALPVVLIMEKADTRIAETVIANTEGKDQTIMTLNSMQAVTSAEIEEGISYLSWMEENRKVLETALNG